MFMFSDMVPCSSSNNSIKITRKEAVLHENNSNTPQPAKLFIAIA